MNYRRFCVLSALCAAVAACDNTIKDHFERSAVVNLVAPANLLGAAAANGATIHLTWTDGATGETGYRIEANDAPFGSSIPLILVNLPADSAVWDLPTQPNTTYYIRVYATFGTLDSLPSNVITVTTPDVPAAPTNFTATAVTSARIDLAWVNPPGAITGDRVERSLDGGATWSTRFTFVTATTSASDTGLTADTQYGYRVAASNSNGEGGPSSTASATTLSVAMTIYSTSTPANVGRHASLAVTPGGVQHVAHYDVTNGNVLYTTNTGSPLPVTTIDTGPTGTQDVGADGTAVALDGSGKLHIAAHDATSGKLRYITNSSGSFVASTLDSTGFNGQAPRIALSPADGSIHVLYLVDLPGSDNLRHASLTPPGTTWSFEDILAAPTSLLSWSLAADSTGKLHASYAHTDDGLTFELVYGTRSGGAWTFTPVTSAAMPGWNSIAVDGSGVPHLSYYEQSNLRLMHATNAGGSWATEVIHGLAGSTLGLYNSIAVNPSTGRISVAYYDATAKDLRYARKDPGGSWVLKLIEVSGDVGSYCSIALDGAGQVHIAYYDATNGELRAGSGNP